MRLIQRLIVAACLGLATAAVIAVIALVRATPRGAMMPSVHFQGWFGWIAARQEGDGLTWINLERIEAPFANGVVELPSVPAWAAPARGDSDDRGATGPCRVATLAAGWPWRWATMVLEDRTGTSAWVPHAELDNDGEALRKAAAEMLSPARWPDLRVRWSALIATAAPFAAAWAFLLSLVAWLRRRRVAGPRTSRSPIPTR